MFDSSSRALLKSAPDLPEFDPDTIDTLLTEAHVEIATARLAIQRGADSDRSTLTKVRRLASTFEAYVVLDIQPEKKRAAAFVAGVAHQVISMARNAENSKRTLLSAEAIDSTISTTLLFLIADRSADAAEAASRLTVVNATSSMRSALILSIKDLAMGRLDSLLTREYPVDAMYSEVNVGRDSREFAADLLFHECATAIKGLAAEAHGADYEFDVRDALDKVLDLSRATTENLPGLSGMVNYQYAGPHHLASLLLAMIEGVRSSMLARLATPEGANVGEWDKWTISQSKLRPFLWVNHQKAIQSGYLNRGNSMVMTSPTGSGKTTLSMLKIAAVRCSGRSVVYLAPTHALVDQVENDFAHHLADIEAVSVEDKALEELGDALPPFAVMTPERLLALLGFAPELFGNVGLIVFDEFHLIGMDIDPKSVKVGSRSVDAMLSLLGFTRLCPTADLLLMSAMVKNANEIASWLSHVLGRGVHVFDDPWKPTRQLRTCVVYDEKALDAAVEVAAQGETKKERSRVSSEPLGLFSLVAGWHPTQTETFAIRRLSDANPFLNINDKGYLTANRNELAATLAADFAHLGKRVVVFCSDVRVCSSVADSVNKLLPPPSIVLDENQRLIRETIIEDVGDVSAIFEVDSRRAGVHHSDLLPLERRLVEAAFRSKRGKQELGLDVLAATSTIAQGLNLPCDVVILAGTDRSAADDPTGNPRTDLRPHEILNALGRAGRAAYAATGLSVVIPAKPIIIELDEAITSNNEDLYTTFAQQDACEIIYDPIDYLLDRIEVSSANDLRVQALIRRLNAVTPEGSSGLDGIVRRSLGYFQRSSRDASSAETWLEGRRVVLKAAEQELDDPEADDWQKELAIRNGVNPRIISSFADALIKLPAELRSTSDWVGWALDIISKNPTDLNGFLRESALESVFARAHRPGNDAAIKVLSALKKLVEMWCSGLNVVNIETWLLAFIRENEGEVSRQATKSKTAHHARRFIVRLTPDIGFLCGVIGQVAAHVFAEIENSPLDFIELLPQMIRAGDYNRHQFVLRQNMAGSSRVAIHEAYLRLQASFDLNPNSSIDAVRSEVRDALFLDLLRGFDS
ncbi:DEAD/DEAH box helicase [Pseudomonas sp. CFBP13528]|uniref:DEAD/DEAH box helicase n=3 Tax=Bacteria TaxID=2 RepID=UPI0010C0151A|nr:DEAD/DEAH box helicase [Pseudomonas sp. CFBP13528]TKK28972.1 DEAD/DEAH box helicase [Pseudomonas sp. CFBP13528]